MARDGAGLDRVQEFLKQIVYGGNDGIVTTFAIVAGFAGAQADGAAEIGALAVLVFGLANLFADGVSMGLGEFLSLRARDELYRRRHGDLLRRMRHETPALRDRLAGTLQGRGLSPTDAEAVSAILARNPEVMADMLVGQEDGLERPHGARPALNGLSTFAAFLAFGAVPLVPYFLMEATDSTFRLSMLATLTALVGLGLLRRSATGETPGRAVIETVLVGGLCAAVAYAVGMIVGG